MTNASLSNCVIIFGNVNQYQDISKEILETIVASQPNVEFLSKLAYILTTETNLQIKELGRAMKNSVQEKKTLCKVLSEAIDPVQKAMSISSSMVALWPRIWPKLQPFLANMPDLAAKLEELILKLPHL